MVLATGCKEHEREQTLESVCKVLCYAACKPNHYCCDYLNGDNWKV